MKEFRSFILRGNVVDLAVGVIIGAAFTAVVSSLVKDVLTPLLGVFGSPDFSYAFVQVGKAKVMYGLFLNALISFLLVSFAVFFFIVKPTNKLMARRKTEKDVEHETRECPHCLSSIPTLAVRCAFCTSKVTPEASTA